ncbi:homocysteine S-methyltransferase family protein, partial [OM182 bacterium]|nr:homocysteine S-methyltransferase family protein [OM182 bacterium]
MTRVTLLDGSIGQELVKRSGDPATAFWSTTVMLDKPDLVAEVHADYFRSGATVATTNTYTALRERLATGGLEGRLTELWDTALDAARDARDANGFGRVAGSVGPLFASYRPDICPPAEEAAMLYAEVVEALSLRADLLLIETMSSIEQAEGAMRAAKKASLPVWLSFSVDDFDGT